MTKFAVNTTILRTVPLFSLFSDSELMALVPAIQHKHFSRQSFMLRARDNTNALYVILSGKAKVVIDNGEGREVTVTIIGPGELFGEMSLIDEKPRSASVQALEPCEVLYIAKPAFMACFGQHPSAVILMLRGVIGRLREANRKIANLALLDVHGRVARLLIEFGKEVAGVWVVDTGSEEIARMVGASREMVSRVLKVMIEDGLIRREKRKIIVLDRASMTQRLTPIGQYAPVR